MRVKKFLSILFIMILSTQVFPLEEVNLLMRGDVSIELLEEINENHCSTQTNQLNEHEHNKLHFSMGFLDLLLTSHTLMQSVLFNEYRLKDITHPYIEESEIPPNSDFFKFGYII